MSGSQQSCHIGVLDASSYVRSLERILDFCLRQLEPSVDGIWGAHLLIRLLGLLEQCSAL